MRDWAGSDGVRGERSQGEVKVARGTQRDAGPVGAFAATPDEPQGRHSWTRSASSTRGSAVVLATVALLALCVLTLVAATPSLHRPRDPEDIRRILADGSHSGECDRCHTMHGADQVEPQPKLLLAPDDNTLCNTCHTTPWEGGSFAGPELYSGTGHGSTLTMVWPGPTPPPRTEIDAPGKCLNCHDAHGREDSSGLIPALGLQREEALCLTCHDGSPSTANVQSDLQKPYRHPVTDYADRHTGPLESLPSDFGTMPLNRRHSECVDCHNPHVSRPDRFPPSDDEASKTTLGVSRVTILNGVAGSAPSYALVTGADTLAVPTDEYTLCFKCHSSWTTQPSGQTDLAKALNPANPSYHPVEARGRNPLIHPLSFASGWGASSITRCGDCHGSDFGTARGPHGSTYRYILKQPYTASPANRPTDSNEICFACHSYDVYANPSSPVAVQGYSRFGPPQAASGHVQHVGEQQVPCYACHITHGSTTLPHLLVIGRNPGLQSYTETASGGSCSPTCHGSQSYSVNYAR